MRAETEEGERSDGQSLPLPISHQKLARRSGDGSLLAAPKVAQLASTPILHRRPATTQSDKLRGSYGVAIRRKGEKQTCSVP